jgi:hypothetical protein
MKSFSVSLLVDADPLPLPFELVVEAAAVAPDTPDKANPVMSSPFPLDIARDLAPGDEWPTAAS